MAKASILLKLMEAYELNNFRFEQEIKAANGSISRLIDNNKEISRNLINKIRLRYPEVKEEWLETGKGPMRAKPDPKRKIILDAIIDIQHDIERLKEQVRLLKKMV